jgi:hypothetical protein
MAQSYTTKDGITLYEPGTVVSTQVINGASGTAAAGVVVLLGEAEEGPAYSEEESLDQNTFGPDQAADVARKYGSGRIVDAFRSLVTAANDAAIQGAVSQVKIVKTNLSSKSSLAVSNPGFGAYTTLSASRAGVSGNRIKYRSEVSQPETAPSTGIIAYTPAASTVSFKLRTDGGAQKSITTTAYTSGPSFVASIEDIAKGILATGGQRSEPLDTLAAIAITASVPVAGKLLVTLASGSVFSTAPVIGQTVVIPLNGQYSATSDSALKGAGNVNAGSYVVESVSNTISNASVLLKSVNTLGTVTATSGVISANEDDIIVFANVEISSKTGMDRKVALGLTPNWAVTSNDGTNAVMEITSAQTWVAQPQVGDTLKLASSFAGLAAGFYEVTGSTTKTVSVARLSVGSAGTTGTVSSSAAGFTVLKPAIDGLGKSLEIDGTVSAILKNTDGTTATLSNTVLYSDSEYINLSTISKDNVEDSYEIGGNIVLSLGSTQALATAVVTDSKMTFKENNVTVFELSYSDFNTMKSLSDAINSYSGYSAALASNKYSSMAPSKLDKATYSISSTGAKLARIKRDAADFSEAMASSSVVSAAMTATAGLPEQISPDKFLAGGARGGSSSFAVSSAIDACDSVDTNFIVSLFSKDASEDIVDSETDAASTYTIDAVNALLRNHANKNSALKAKKNRICFVSKEATYKLQKEAASDLGSFRVALSINNVKNPDSSGKIKTFQPWMESVLAAGMQAAAGYKGIVKKFASASGVFHKAGDFNSTLSSQREDAIKSGILFLESVKTGGFRWVSDQTSYTIDNNFVFNSLQAVYVSDLMSLSLIESFDRVIVGQSVADVTATGALGFLQAQLFNFLRLKWITASDDAPAGYKNATVSLKGGVMNVSVEVKLAGLIYFVPINLAISEVVQEAQQ